MTAQELTLNIAVNCGRLCTWAVDKREARVYQFLEETKGFVEQLDRLEKTPRFLATYEWFKEDFARLAANVELNDDWAESMLTWANILTHRAGLLE